MAINARRETQLIYWFKIAANHCSLRQLLEIPSEVLLDFEEMSILAILLGHYLLKH